MSFLKITDPSKREAFIKDYIETRKRIKSNMIAKKTGESELRADLSKFYRPITETQKATTKETIEELKPISQSLKVLEKREEEIKEKKEKEEEIKEKEKEEEQLGEIAYLYLNKEIHDDGDLGIRKEGKHHFIGDTHIIIDKNNIIIPEEAEYKGTRGLWELLTRKFPNTSYINNNDIEAYRNLMVRTNAIYKKNDASTNRGKSTNNNTKWRIYLKDVWDVLKKERKQPKQPVYQDPEPVSGFGLVVIPSDPNALLERLDLLLASQEAGHTGVVNELVSICDELKRQKVINADDYKKLNSIIKK